MYEELSIPIATRNSAVKPVQYRQAQLGTAIAQALLHHGIVFRVFHQAAFANVFGLQFKLRFDQHEQVRVGFEQGHEGRQHKGERDEAHIARYEVKTRERRRGIVIFSYKKRSIQLAGVPRVHTFDTAHTRVFADARMHLAVAHINTRYVSRAALQQAIGEATGALAYVQALQPLHAQRGVRKSRLQLETATRDEACLVVVGQLNRRILGQVVAFGKRLPLQAVVPLALPARA